MFIFILQSALNPASTLVFILKHGREREGREGEVTTSRLNNKSIPYSSQFLMPLTFEENQVWLGHKSTRLRLLFLAARLAHLSHSLRYPSIYWFNILNIYLSIYSIYPSQAFYLSLLSFYCAYFSLQDSL